MKGCKESTLLLEKPAIKFMTKNQMIIPSISIFPHLPEKYTRRLGRLLAAKLLSSDIAATVNSYHPLRSREVMLQDSVSASIGFTVRVVLFSLP